MTDNLAIWNTLGRTSPEHTKGFTRGGGFKGTAVSYTHLGAIAIAAFGVRIDAEIALPLATEETPTQYRVRR